MAIPRLKELTPRDQHKMSPPTPHIVMSLGPCQTELLNDDDRGGTIEAMNIDRLVDENWSEVYRYAYRWTGNAADAEDLTQQVFLLAQRHLTQLRDPSRALSWLMTIVRNTYWKQRRRNRPKSASEIDVRLDGFADPRSASSVADASSIQHALDQLDDSHKEILLMFYFEQLSYREIAEKIGIKLGTVMSRLSRAKTQMRHCLADSSADGETL
jgi:RNA polymerase sigma-70 factor (ECF subfamily)